MHDAIQSRNKKRQLEKMCNVLLCMIGGSCSLYISQNSKTPEVRSRAEQRHSPYRASAADMGRQRRCGPAVRRPVRRRNPIRTARKDGIQTYMYTNYLFSSDTEDSHVGRCILSNLLHFHLFLLEGFRIFRCRLRAGYDTLPEMCRERKCFSNKRRPLHLDQQKLLKCRRRGRSGHALNGHAKYAISPTGAKYLQRLHAKCFEESYLARPPHGPACRGPCE